jgi:uncharacterized protein YukE
MAMASRRDPRSVPIQFFVDSELHEEWGRQARFCNTSLTGYIKQHLPGLKDVPMVAKNQQLAESVDTLAALRTDLKKIANNVNQTAMVLNSHEKQSGQLPTQLDLRQEYEDLNRLINQVARDIRSIGESLTRTS